MKGVNLAIILGNVGNDPEMRDTQSGDKVASFSVATSEQWKDKNGQKQEKTEWHKVTAFGHLAGIIGQYVRKGSKVYISGKIVTQKWDKNGVTQYSTGIIANEMQMLDGKQDSGKGSYQAPQSQQRSAAAPQPQRTTYTQEQQNQHFPDSFDDDIAF
jgi:single-strand DNA-binding protein